MTKLAKNSHWNMSTQEIINHALSMPDTTRWDELEEAVEDLANRQKEVYEAMRDLQTAKERYRDAMGVLKDKKESLGIWEDEI